MPRVRVVGQAPEAPTTVKNGGLQAGEGRGDSLWKPG